MAINEQEFGEMKEAIRNLKLLHPKVTKLYVDNETSEIEHAKTITKLQTEMSNIMRKSIGAGAVTGTGGAGLIWYLLEKFGQ